MDWHISKSGCALCFMLQIDESLDTCIQYPSSCPSLLQLLTHSPPDPHQGNAMLNGGLVFVLASLDFTRSCQQQRDPHAKHEQGPMSPLPSVAIDAIEVCVNPALWTPEAKQRNDKAHDLRRGPSSTGQVLFNTLTWAATGTRRDSHAPAQNRRHDDRVSREANGHAGVFRPRH